MTELWPALPPLQPLDESRSNWQPLSAVESLKPIGVLELLPLSRSSTYAAPSLPYASRPALTEPVSLQAIERLPKLQDVPQLHPLQNFFRRKRRRGTSLARQPSGPGNYSSLELQACRLCQYLIIGEASQSIVTIQPKLAALSPAIQTLFLTAAGRCHCIRQLKSKGESGRMDQQSPVHRSCARFLNAYLFELRDACLSVFTDAPDPTQVDGLLQQCKETTAVLQELTRLLALDECFNSNLVNAMEEIESTLEQHETGSEMRSVLSELLICLLEPILAEIYQRTRLSLESAAQSVFLGPDEDARPSLPSFIRSATCAAIHETVQGLTLLYSHDRPAYNALNSLSTCGSRISFFADEVDRQYAIVDAWDLEDESASSKPSPDDDDFSLLLEKYEGNVVVTTLEDALDVFLDWPVEIQLSRVRARILDLMLNKLHLQRHFELLYQVPLFGNGRFVVSLTDALLADSTSPICVYNRAGLWPPSNVHMNLATRAMLEHSIGSDYMQPAQPGDTAGEREYLGHLGFRLEPDLEHHQIPRDALEALSFLKFDYRPPAPLDQVITNQSLVFYAHISGFLLLLLRMVFVVDQLTVQARMHRLLVTHRVPQALRFRLEALWFVHALADHCFQRILTPAWCAFQQALAELVTNSPADLRDRHLAMLQQMTRGCLLDAEGAERMEAVKVAFGAVLTLYSIPADQREGWSADADLMEALYDRFTAAAAIARVDELEVLAVAFETSADQDEEMDDAISD